MPHASHVRCALCDWQACIGPDHRYDHLRAGRHARRGRGGGRRRHDEQRRRSLRAVACVDGTLAVALLDVFKQAFENEDLDGPQRAPSPSAVTAERLESASWELSLAVKGISSSDNPSADLYGPRTSVRFGALIEPLEATVPLSLRPARHWPLWLQPPYPRPLPRTRSPAPHPLRTRGPNPTSAPEPPRLLTAGRRRS